MIIERRVNDVLEAKVNTGLATMLMISIHDGAKVMKDSQVTLHVASRLVRGSNLRRSTDWKH